MKLIKLFTALFVVGSIAISVAQEQKTTKPKGEIESFSYVVEQFADINVLRYQISSWDNLTLKEKQLVYYLTEAGTCGRDIMWDQHYIYNLKIRKALENIYTQYKGDKKSDDWKNFEVYLKRVWFSNGIHHHYSNDKIKPVFSKDYFRGLLKETKTDLDPTIVAILFNDLDAKKVNLDESKGLIAGSAINFFDKGITEKEAEAFYAKMKSPDASRPYSFGLNSKLIRNKKGQLEEKVWKSGN